MRERLILIPTGLCVFDVRFLHSDSAFFNVYFWRPTKKKSAFIDARVEDNKTRGVGFPRPPGNVRVTRILEKCPHTNKGKGSGTRDFFPNKEAASRTV